MIKTISIVQDDVGEPYLVHSNWIEIDITKPSTQAEVIKSFDSTYNKALKKLNLNSLKKIETGFSTKWHILPRVIYDHGFHRCLTRWELNLQKTPITHNPSIDISATQKPHFKDLVPLLRQQADYHNNLYPNYFKSSDDINWSDYQKFYQKNLGNPPDTTCLTYKLENKIIGLLMGDINQKSAHIWELIIDQNCRRGGIGSRLTSHFIEICQNKKINQIEVETGWNQVASRFYKKLRFIPITQTWYKNF